MSVAGSQAKPRKRDYSSKSSALRPFRTKLLDWKASFTQVHGTEVADLVKAVFRDQQELRGRARGDISATPLIPCCNKQGKLDRYQEFLWDRVKSNWKIKQNFSLSLQPSVAISRPRLSCQGSDCGNSPYLGHFLLVCHFTCGFLANCLAHNINTLIDPGEGWSVYGVCPEDLGLFSSRLSMSPWFYHQQAALLLQPWSALHAYTHWTNEQVFLSFCWIIVLGISFFTAAHLWLVKWRLLLWLSVSLRDRAMTKNVEWKPCPKTFAPIRTWPLPSPDRQLLHYFTINL